MPCTIVRHEKLNVQPTSAHLACRKPLCRPAISGCATDTGYCFKCAMLCFIVSYLPRHAVDMLAHRMCNYYFPMLAYL